MAHSVEYEYQRRAALREGTTMHGLILWDKELDILVEEALEEEDMREEDDDA